jgi:hypothetical protein
MEGHAATVLYCTAYSPYFCTNAMLFCADQRNQILVRHEAEASPDHDRIAHGLGTQACFSLRVYSMTA